MDSLKDPHMFGLYLSMFNIIAIVREIQDTKLYKHMRHSQSEYCGLWKLHCILVREAE